MPELCPRLLPRCLLWLALLLPVSTRAQTQIPAPKPPVAWDTVSIHRVKPKASGMENTRQEDQSNGMVLRSFPMLFLISDGYNFSFMPFHDDEISGLPAWAKTEAFDIVAHVAAEDIAAYKKINNLPTKEELEAFAARRYTDNQLMMQSLLVDRFHMQAHWESKERTVYVLKAVKGGTKLQPVATDPEHASIGWSEGALSGKNVPVSVIASALAIPAGRIVLDKTGLDGRYDFELKFTPQNVPAGTNADSPELLTALREQLGLQMETERAAVPTLVIDHIEEPTPN